MRVELDGKGWEPVPGATVSAEEFIAARSLIHEVHQQAAWSPWVLQDRVEEYDAAWETCGQWKPTEPGPPKTLEEREAELEQRLADAEAQYEAKEAQAERDRAERAKNYNPEREQARLALLEEQGILADALRERDELLTAGAAQAPAKDPRRDLLATAKKTVAAKSKEVDDLLAVIGDPETVCDKDGWLPIERRQLALTRFKARRGLQVQTLRARIPDAQARIETLQYQDERAQTRESLRRDQALLARWEQMQPLQAAGMCSECGQPAGNAS
jgi:hypothetical protein